uniref:F-box/LRR-repeat protein At3g48880-like n=1 Tax=Fragaria vesca subsp. vesca TaxID=101020 RepID=UPI0005C9C8C8|nr:PREDICTED: F-box/LRR-repeat protein At3g48880-like [Fragaria vesca subsp. vesca]
MYLFSHVRKQSSLKLITMESASDLAGTIYSNTMLNSKSKHRNWAEMEQGILLKIFTALNVMDLVGSVSVVCSTWHSVCHEPCLWESINMSVLAPNLIVTEQEVHNLSNEEHSNKVTRFLNTALNLSRGKISSLIFNFYIPHNR